MGIDSERKVGNSICWGTLISASPIAGESLSPYLEMQALERRHFKTLWIKLSLREVVPEPIIILHLTCLHCLLA
jgi:hypothetical protein